MNKALHTENPRECAKVVSRAVNLIYVLSALIHPFMPETADQIQEQLNAPPRAVPDLLSNDIMAGHTIGKPEHLFKKIDDSMADVWRQKFGGNTGSETPQPSADATHVTPGMSKRKAAQLKKAADKAAAAADANTPKSAEVLACEQTIAEQGQLVRELKAKPKTEETDKEVAEAVDKLKKLKVELTTLVQQQPEA